MGSRRGLSYRGRPPDSRRRIGNRGREIPMRKYRTVPVLLMFLFFFPFLSSAACDPSSRLKSIRLPPGFAIEIYAPDVPGARSMTLGERGTVFVGTRGEGKVYAVVRREGDRGATEVIVVAKGRNSPNGVAFRDGALYVAEISRILRFDRIESRLADPGPPGGVSDGSPRATHHPWPPPGSASIPARCFRRNTGTTYSSRSTVRGTGALPSGIG